MWVPHRGPCLRRHVVSAHVSEPLLLSLRGRQSYQRKGPLLPCDLPLTYITTWSTLFLDKAAFSGFRPSTYLCVCVGMGGRNSSRGNHLHPLRLAPLKSFLLCCLGVDECADSSICPSRATCIDTPDSYYCTCKRGFQSSSGLDQFTDPGVKCNGEFTPPQHPPAFGRKLRGSW